MVEQAFVDVSNLFDVQASEGETAWFDDASDTHLQVLEGVEQVQDRAVVDFEWSGWSVLPGGASWTAFQEGKTVGIEEAASIGWQVQVCVINAAGDHAEDGE